ncbi:MAG: hypothetical protein DMG32_09870 [Acidobacteria bacterium]|nr:MAG: hypothetical protein DMG32_09870 [Acidobacteriota bacterium]
MPVHSAFISGRQCSGAQTAQNDALSEDFVRRVSHLTLLLAIAFGFLSPEAVTAQERKGTITGTVTDSSGGVLKGAQISFGTSERQRCIRCSRPVFYQWPGRLPSVTLERDEGEGKYVQVRGTQPGLTNTTIDGMTVPSPEKGVRQIKFDAIPADIVEAVEINKTLQANMDGDGIGGSVNLVTKTAGERPTVSFSEVGGYTPIVGGRGLTEATGTIGQRFGAQKRLGLLIGGSYDWNGRGIDDVEPVSDVATFANGTTALWKDSQDIREYRYYRSRWGLAGSADYKLGEASNIYIRGLYSNFKNYGDRWVYSLTDNTPVFNANVPSQFPNAPTLLGSNGCGFDQAPAAWSVVRIIPD